MSSKLTRLKYKNGHQRFKKIRGLRWLTLLWKNNTQWLSMFGTRLRNFSVESKCWIWKKKTIQDIGFNYQERMRLVQASFRGCLYLEEVEWDLSFPKFMMTGPRLNKPENLISCCIKGQETRIGLMDNGHFMAMRVQLSMQGTGHWLRYDFKCQNISWIFTLKLINVIIQWYRYYSQLITIPCLINTWKW